MTAHTSVAEQLQRLSRRWDDLTDVPEPPRSTMDVVEYGLGQQRRAEVYLNRLLCYLLDPEQPHGMGDDLLDAFLDGLPDACGFDEDTADLSEVRVAQQVPVWDEPEGERGEDATPGYLDLLLDVPNEWFLLVELKFSAEERGTEFYCDATQLGDRRVGEYESGQYHLFLHQADRPEASGDCFANWTWSAFVRDTLEGFLAENAPRYPQRTATQLHDLRDDVRTITDMSEHSDTDREKAALYLEHAEAIADVTEAFETEWAAYGERWGSDLQTALAHERVRSPPTTDDGFPVVSIDRDTGDAERWILRDNGGDWQHVFKHGWWQREARDEPLEARAGDRDDLRIGFYHRMAANRAAAVSDHTLRFDFRCMGSNPTAFSDIYERCFEDRRGQFEQALSPTRATTTGNKLTLVEGTYPIDVDGHETFFEAYTAALRDAFVELVVENAALIHCLDDAFTDALSEYR
jgi:hypothetical protein